MFCLYCFFFSKLFWGFVFLSLSRPLYCSANTCTSLAQCCVYLLFFFVKVQKQSCCSTSSRLTKYLLFVRTNIMLLGWSDKMQVADSYSCHLLVTFISILYLYTQTFSICINSSVHLIQVIENIILVITYIFWSLFFLSMYHLPSQTPQHLSFYSSHVC